MKKRLGLLSLTIVGVAVSIIAFPGLGISALDAVGLNILSQRIFGSLTLEGVLLYALILNLVLGIVAGVIAQAKRSWFWGIVSALFPMTVVVIVFFLLLG